MKRSVRILGTVVVIFGSLLLGGCNKGQKCKSTVVAISGEHGHKADVPADHVNRGIAGTYPVTGGEHEHVLPLKDQDFADLKAGKTVHTRTTSVNGHTHEVEIHCE